MTTTEHERRISIGHPLRVGSDYKFALRRAYDHYHRGALGDAAELAARASEAVPNHDAASAVDALFLYANVAARRSGTFPDDSATSPYLDGEGTTEGSSVGGGAAAVCDVAEVVDLYADVARIIEAELGSDPPRLAALCLNRGIVLIHAGQLDAAESMLNATLALLRKTFGSDHVVAADAYHNLGVLAEMRLDGELAKAHYVESLLIRAKFDDSLRNVDLGLVETMTNLALVAWRFDGDVAECIRQLQRLVPLARKLPKRVSTDLALAAVLSHLGAALCSVGSAARAVGYLTQAHRLRAARLGGNHPLTLKILHLLDSSIAATSKAPPES